MGTPFPLLKCLRTHKAYGRHCEPFSGQNALGLNCPILHVHFQTFLRDDTPGSSHLPAVLDPDSNFRFAVQRSHCSCFRKRPLLYAGSWSLSALSSDLMVQRTIRSTIGERSLQSAAASTWNALSHSVRYFASVLQFRSRPKTELFARSYQQSY